MLVAKVLHNEPFESTNC